MKQKITYIHLNPVRKGWVAAAEHWCFSSAHEAMPGAIPDLRCDPWQ